MEKITESDSHYRHLEKMTVGELLYNMNKEDQTVPQAISKSINQIEPLIKIVVKRMEEGGRLFYLGAGTSGRLGILDASECPPTFGVPADWVIGILAGGEDAIRNSIEDAEDDQERAWKDLEQYGINPQDVVVGIAASGTTPYVVHGLKDCRKNGITTGCITCNLGTPISKNADFPIEVIVGPEFVTGSTRMKSGTAQKLVLNMISTSVMIKMGRVLDNKMVDMQLSNSKLMERACKMLMKILNISFEEASQKLLEKGSVRKVLEEASDS